MTWETKKIEDCLEAVAYTNKIQRKEFLESGAFPIISQEAEAINGYWNNKKDVFSCKKPVVIFGDHTKVLKYIDFDFVLGADGVKILCPKNFLETRFLYYFLRNINLKSLGYARHFRLLKEVEISYPESKIEQRRIVKILDEMFEKVAKAKENAEKNLRSSKELFEVYLESALSNKKVDWKSFSLGDVCDIRSKLIDPRKSEFLDLIHVGAGNIEIKTGNLVDLKTAKEEKLISGKFLFDDTVILYSKIRPYLMKVAKPDFQGLCSADMYPLSPKEKIITRDYLYYLLLTSTFTKFAIKGSARAGMPKVNREHLFSYKLVLPSLTEQKAIVAKLDALSAETKKLEGIYKKKLADLEELKKSVLKKAFEGEL